MRQMVHQQNDVSGVNKNIHLGFLLYNKGMKNSDLSLVQTVRLNMSRPRAYEYFTNEYLIIDWAFPDGLIMASCKMDLRQGGRWRACMLREAGQGETNQEFWVGGVFEEVLDERRIVFTCGLIDENGHSQRDITIRVEFSDCEDGTELSFQLNDFQDRRHKESVGNACRMCLEKLQYQF